MNEINEVSSRNLTEITEQQRDEGNLAEYKIEEWFNLRKVIFLDFGQSIEKCSIALKAVGGKRADYFVTLPNLGVILIDAKSRKWNIRHENFTIDEINDVQPLKKLQDLFRIPVWFVISSPENGHNTWYWIPLEMVLNAPLKIRMHDGRPFRTISIKSCITLGWNDDLDKIFQFKI